jgi:hypothetical protein
MRSLTAAAAVLTSLIATDAAAQPCADNSVTAQQVGVDQYDPTALSNPVVRIALRLTEGCEPNNVALRPRNETRFAVIGPGGELLSRRIASADVQVSNPVSTILSRAAVASLASGETLNLELLEFQGGQFIAPGLYQLDLDIILNGQTAGVLPIVVQVEPAVQLLGAAAAGVIDVDLGDVGAGAQADRTLHVRSNVRLNMQVTSEYGGRLRHRSGAQLGHIPYILSVNGARIAAETVSVTPLQNAPGQMLGATVDVRVAPVQQAFAGRYTDILTISFVAE